MLYKINTFQDIITIVDNSPKIQIHHYLSTMTASSLSNKNIGQNTPIFSISIPAIRSIYGSSTNVLNNPDRSMSSEVESCCDLVLGTIQNTNFNIYTRADGLLAYYYKKYYNNTSKVS